MILTLRTDKPDAEIGLYKDGEKIAYKSWEAHRKLAETIHDEINSLLQDGDLKNVTGLVMYKGPGSFTGLRIGASVANALASSLKVPIVGTAGESWTEEGISLLNSGKNDKVVVPEYGAPVHITQPKK